ncbi:MAG: HAD family hydrolase [Rhodospirillales bacterium]|nr:HAD family hydrolase [Rhodospirillales bacterium]
MSANLLVIFDCDGVLVDSEPIASRVMAESLSEVGYAITVDACNERFKGMPMPDILKMVEESWGRALPPDFAALIHERDFAAFRRELMPIPDVREAVEALPYAKCVASSGAPEKMQLTLTLTGLIELFEPHLFSAHMVENGKPAPDLFLFAADTMGFPPQRCVVVEDSRPGVEAAVAAGMRTLGFTGGGHGRSGSADALRDAGATRTFSSMTELPGLLSNFLKDNVG